MKSARCKVGIGGAVVIAASGGRMSGNGPGAYVGCWRNRASYYNERLASRKWEQAVGERPPASLSLGGAM